MKLHNRKNDITILFRPCDSSTSLKAASLDVVGKMEMLCNNDSLCPDKLDSPLFYDGRRLRKNATTVASNATNRMKKFSELVYDGALKNDLD